MPGKDIIHDTVKTALIKDGWTITHDPFAIRLGTIRVFVDLGAERLIAAEKQNRKIAVEIKSFVSPSPVEDLEKAIGQYNLYSALLTEIESERQIYLAISESTYVNLFDTLAGRVIIQNLSLKLIIVTLNTQEVVKWIE